MAPDGGFYLLASEVAEMERELTPGNEAMAVLQQMVGFDKGEEFKDELIALTRGMLVALGDKRISRHTVTELCGLAVKIMLDDYKAGAL